MLKISVFSGFLLLAPLVASGQNFDTTVSMQDGGAATYYVSGEIEGFGPLDLMVDTGSGYMTINEEMLAVLQREGRAHYVKDLSGILANGARMVVPVYAISAVNIGGQCWLRDVEAAVFPGKTRSILGLSALSKAAPFIFSMDPPQLVLSNCSGVTKATATAG
ncbi:MAG: clan AA aspartic protease [Pseudomonadota bacterium]|nr:MAG: clan AA aspartic protease [Pseudomonadota bacterium]